MADPLSDFPLKDFPVTPLLSWLETSGRAYPWGEEPSPYRVWISEVMLQQTVVSAAVDHFKRWIILFPHTEALAEAEEQAVLKAWEGLGYYSRARNLHKGARYLVDQRDGLLPDSYEELIKVPGIGDYTARAILSLAYGKASPVLDANVRRIGQRLTARADWDLKADRALLGRLETLIPRDTPGAFNAALMQLGQLICRTGRPDCQACPLGSVCLAFRQGKAEGIPVKKSRTLKEKHTILFLIRRDDSLLLYRRQNGIGKGLWFLPGVEKSEAPLVRSRLEKMAREAGSLPEKTHFYTTWKDFLYPEIYELSGSPDTTRQVFSFAPDEQVEWVCLSVLKDYPTASVYRKILDEASGMFRRIS